ncbi:MAG TPA: hypothetical protein VGF48_16120 [Thermoanaerobaculia bacterium]
MPRATNDVDVVIAPTRDQLVALLAQFPPADFYSDLDDALDALERRSQAVTRRGTVPAAVAEMRLYAFTLAVAVLLAIAPVADAQDARNAVYFELGGSAIVPSFNYERRVSEAWFGRVGFSVITSETVEDSDTDTTIVIPITASWISHRAANHHLEAGGGLTVAAGDRQELFDSIDDEEDQFSAVIATGIIGYRYQKPDGGFQFRAVFTPLIGSGVAAPWAGVSFGYAW